MFGSSILEVAIGIMFIYLLVSLICSAINESFSSFINKRGENLFEGIRNLLNDPTFTGLAQKLYNHGLVDGISQSSKNSNKANRRPSYMASKTFALALIDILSSQCAGDSWREIAEQRRLELMDAKRKLELNPGDSQLQKIYASAQLALEQAEDMLTSAEPVKRAYDDAEYAAGNVRGPNDTQNIKIAKHKLQKALTIGRMLAADLPEPLANIERAVACLPDGHTKESLFVLLNKTEQVTRGIDQANAAAYQMEVLQANIEKWFNDAMDRVSGWYKRWTQQVLLGIAIVVVLIGNVDTLMLIKRFSRDSALLASVVTAADQAMQTDPTRDNSARERLLEAANQLPLPVGWTKQEGLYQDDQIPDCSSGSSSDCVLNWSVKLLGLIMSVLAVQLGAPFWFDLLGQFMKVRFTGPVPAESATGDSRRVTTPRVGVVTINATEGAGTT